MSENVRYKKESYAGGFAITPSDSADLVDPISAIYVGGLGNITVDMVDGTNITFSAVPVGTVLEIRCTKVYSTGTTASNLVGLK